MEDNLPDAILVREVIRLEELPLELHVATDGQEAIDFIARAESTPDAPCPHLVLLDLKLPKVSGLDVLRRIKSDDRTRLTPVVVLTSSSEQNDIVSCYRNGANSYVQKPVEFEKFLEAIHHLAVYWMEISQSPAGLA